MVLPEKLVRHEKILNLCVAVSASAQSPGCKLFEPFLDSLLLCWGTRTLNVQEDTLSLLKAGICKKSKQTETPSTKCFIFIYLDFSFGDLLFAFYPVFLPLF